MKAPTKRAVWIEHSRHPGMIEEPGRVPVGLLQDVLPLATEGERAK